MQIVGLHHPPTAAIAQLSGGQKQLLNIATALAARPDVLVMDEPAAMLDPDARDRLEHIVQTVTSNGTAVIWITHHLEESTLSDRIMAMNKGRCVYDGTPMSFFIHYQKETRKIYQKKRVREAMPCRKKEGNPLVNSWDWSRLSRSKHA